MKNLWGKEVKHEVPEPEVKAKRFSPFDFINSIYTGTENIFGGEHGDVAERDYEPWMINKGLSHGVDTLFYANEINMYSHLTKQMQYDYYFNAIRKKKRYNKWPKPQKDPNIGLVMEYYKYNRRLAEQAVKLLTTDQLKEIENRLSEGGVS